MSLGLLFLACSFSQYGSRRKEEELTVITLIVMTGITFADTVQGLR